MPASNVLRIYIYGSDGAKCGYCPKGHHRTNDKVINIWIGLLIGIKLTFVFESDQISPAGGRNTFQAVPWPLQDNPPE